MSDYKLEVTDWLPVPEAIVMEAKTPRIVLHGHDYTVEIDRLLKGNWELSNADGKLRKRLRMAWYQQKGCDPPWWVDQHLNEFIGGVAALPVKYKLTDMLNWPEKSYGASWSCMWTSNRHFRAMLVNVGAYGLLTENAKGKGNGRAFLVPHKGSVVVINARGPSIFTMAAITAAHFGDEEGPNSTAFRIMHPPLALQDAFYTDRDDLLVGDRRQECSMTLDNCYCSAKFSGYLVDEYQSFRVCEKCPFDRERRWPTDSE